MEISFTPKEITRRHMLAAAGAFLAGSCAPEDPRARLDGHGTAGKALSVSSDVTYPPIERFNAYNQQLRLSGLIWLSATEVLRNDKIIGRWTTFREGCLKGCSVPVGAR